MEIVFCRTDEGWEILRDDKLVAWVVHEPGERDGVLTSGRWRIVMATSDGEKFVFGSFATRWEARRVAGKAAVLDLTLSEWRKLKGEEVPGEN